MNDKTQIMKRSSDEQLEIAIQALWRIAPTRQCEVFRSGIGSCFKTGRTINAKDEADRCCDSCIAHDALDRMERGDHPLEIAPEFRAEMIRTNTIIYLSIEDRIDQLARAGALIAAEIDRLLRLRESE